MTKLDYQINLIESLYLSPEELKENIAYFDLWSLSCTSFHVSETSYVNILKEIRNNVT